MRNALLALLLLMLSPLVGAEAPEAARIEAIRQLDFLVGEWKGEGWVRNRDGSTEKFASTEVVKQKLMGAGLLIEGVHTGFEALAVVTYDEKAKQYRWRSFTSRGAGVDVEAKITGDKTLEWQPSPAARYVIRISDTGAWEEVGEYTPDQGKTWKQFFEMRLQRVP